MSARKATLSSASRDLIILYLVLLGLAWLVAACAPLEQAQHQVASKLFVTKYDPETGEPYLTEEPTELGAAVRDGLSIGEWILFGTAGGGGVLWGLLKTLALWKRSPAGKYLPPKPGEEEPPETPPSPASSAGAVGGAVEAHKA